MLFTVAETTHIFEKDMPEFNIDDMLQEMEDSAEREQVIQNREVQARPDVEFEETRTTSLNEAGTDLRRNSQPC